MANRRHDKGHTGLQLELFFITQYINSLHPQLAPQYGSEDVS